MALPSLNNDASFTDVVRQSSKDQMKLELQNLSTLGEIKSILKLQYEEQLAFRAEQRAAAEEARREALNKLKPTDDKKGGGDTPGGPGDGATSSFGSLTILAGILASLTGLDDVIRTIQLPKTIRSFSAVLKPLSNSFKNFTKAVSISVINSKPFQAIKNFFEPFFKFLDNSKKSLSSFKPAAFVKAQSIFKSVGNFMRGVFKFLDTARIYIGVLSLEAFEKAQKAFKSFADFMKPVTNFLVATGKVLRQSDIVAGALNAAGRAVSSFTRFLSPLLKFFSGTSKVLGPVMKGFAPILRIGGRVFLGPILAVIDFVQGFIKGFGGEDGSLIKGLFFGLTEVFKGFVTYPLDLIKSGISWLLGKLGFKVAEDALDSFTFSGGVDRFVEAITDDPLGMIAKIAMLPYDIIKGGISWVLGKLGFKGGAEVLDNFSFADTFGSLLKGDFQIMDKVMKFFSDIGDGIKALFDLIPSLDDIKMGIISAIPTSILKVARASGLLDEDTENLITRKEKQEELDEKEARIKELAEKEAKLESKDRLSVREERQLKKIRAEKEKLESEMDKANAELRGAQRDVQMDQDAKKDERSNRELAKAAGREKAEIMELQRKVRLDESFLAGGQKRTYIDNGRQLSNEEARARAQEEMQQRKDMIERLEKSRFEKLKVLRARAQIKNRQDAKRDAKRRYTQAEEEIIEALSETEMGYSRAIGESRFRQMSQADKDSLIESKMGDAEEGLAKALIGGKTTGYAVDAGSRAAAEAANQNQPINVVSAPQTDASTTVNNQTTNVAPGAAMARNPDSSFRMGTFNIM